MPTAEVGTDNKKNLAITDTDSQQPTPDTHITDDQDSTKITDSDTRQSKLQSALDIRQPTPDNNNKHLALSDTTGNQHQHPTTNTQ
jgi:hypothetical protein